MRGTWRTIGLAASLVLAAPEADAQRGRDAPRIAARPAPPVTRGRGEFDRAQQQAAPRLTRTYAITEHGYRFRRGELLIAGRDSATFATAESMGMVPIAHTPLKEAGLLLGVYRAPPHVDARALRDAIRIRHPDAAIDLNYVYEPRGAAASAPMQIAAPDIGARTVGMVDVGPPTLAWPGAQLRTISFADSTEASSPHATAVAAVLLNTMRSRAPTVLAANAVERESPRYAAAASIARGLDWAASGGAPVINVSLSGPPNAALAAVARALAARGVAIVAAVGNHGPHAAPAYPAAIPEVIAVTAIDARGQIYRRANRGAHVDFAAPGAWNSNRVGTSFASPVVAGLLARRIESADVSVTRRAIDALAAAAADAGASGRDDVFGAGLVTSTTW